MSERRESLQRILRLTHEPRNRREVNFLFKEINKRQIILFDEIWGEKSRNKHVSTEQGS